MADFPWGAVGATSAVMSLVFSVGVLALVQYMRRYFIAREEMTNQKGERKYAYRSEVDGFGARVDVVERMSIQLRERQDANVERLLRVEHELKHSREWTMDTVVKPFSRAVAQLERTAENQTRMAAVLDGVVHRLEMLENSHRGGYQKPQNRGGSQ